MSPGSRKPEYRPGRLPRADVAGILTCAACHLLAGGVYLILLMIWS